MIKSVNAREIIDSRGSPTLETEITTSDGVFRGSAPSGASTGSAEAFELRDGGRRLGGKGVLKAVANTNKIIAPLLIGKDEGEQRHLDKLIIEKDGTPDKRRLGGNAIVSVSIALCKAGAAARGKEVFRYISALAGTTPIMPVPLCNLINGGKHAGLKNDFQEHMVAPVKAMNFTDAMEIILSVQLSLQGLLKKRGVNTSLVADEGGFVFGKLPQQRLKVLEEAAKHAGMRSGISLAVDCASSEYYKKGNYFVGRKRSSVELQKYYENLCSAFGVFSIEDPFSENDWPAWREFTNSNVKLQVVGDDLLATNPKRVGTAIEFKACNALLIKPNQIGTVTETLAASALAQEAGWNTIVSHRSGETEDAFIAHLAVGLGGGQCKFGAPCRGERTAKYNELIRISEKVKKFGVV